ncbi:uncharacterized protein K444DRAFT_616084 [Hyaloscypha bicolor E]|uniref:Myb-like domain-containing protein n=1 Tax=Hyaloscypha bicolor E TaxID=1095630 RepID=A0A2J6SZS0_9HELO|nr:uncharacterized protein K444DRAFT_616084 [Hyaloscypha bicolor E]PMD56276.1 hypothetical protein K444DRAFT_616084 [Hyaloscypha bicolor E]
MPSQWDHKADKDLLLAIIENGDLKSISWPAIAAKMQAKAYTFTHEACRQHFQKIRKESRNSAGGGDSSSPNKRANTNGVHKSTPRKGSKAHGSFEQSANDDDDEEDLNTPPSKRKRTKKEEGKENADEQSAYLFKVEHGAVIDLENNDIYEG